MCESMTGWGDWNPVKIDITTVRVSVLQCVLIQIGSSYSCGYKLNLKEFSGPRVHICSTRIAWLFGWQGKRG